MGLSVPHTHTFHHGAKRYRIANSCRDATSVVPSTFTPMSVASNGRPHPVSIRSNVRSIVTTAFVPNGKPAPRAWRHARRFVPCSVALVDSTVPAEADRSLNESRSRPAHPSIAAPQPEIVDPGLTLAVRYSIATAPVCEPATGTLGSIGVGVVVALHAAHAMAIGAALHSALTALSVFPTTPTGPSSRAREGRGYCGYQAASRNSMPPASALRNASMVAARFAIGVPFDVQL
jgi:hypothetical protein